MEHAAVRYDSRFMEEAVFFALWDHPEASAFQKARDRLYEIADAEERDRAFQDLNREWFGRLEIADPIENAVREQPLVSSSITCCIVSQAPGKKEEGAELFVSTDEGLTEREHRTVRLLLRPESLLNPERLLTFLRHELFHIADMLDPGFGYEPALPAAEGGPTHDRLLIDRYRTLWDVTIDGRMSRHGWLSESSRADHLAYFGRLFSMLGDRTEEIFSRFFDHEPHTHVELVAFACNPRVDAGNAPHTFHPGSRCSLCGFPSYVFEPEPENLLAEVVAEITQDFPHWLPSQGLCMQCADLYRARRVSHRDDMVLRGSYSCGPNQVKEPHF
jgi:hypothetical protein